MRGRPISNKWASSLGSACTIAPSGSADQPKGVNKNGRAS
jgi:hypothetical protein